MTPWKKTTIPGHAISKEYKKVGHMRIYHELKDGMPMCYWFWAQYKGTLYPFDVRELWKRFRPTNYWVHWNLKKVKEFVQEIGDVETVFGVIREMFVDEIMKNHMNQEVPF